MLCRQLTSDTRNDVLRVDQLLEDPTLYVQLTPTLPANAVGHSAVVQPGRYGSCWVRLQRALPDSVLDALIDEALQARTGAVYVCVPQMVLATPTGSANLALVLSRAMRFHHYHSQTSEMIWYLWARDGEDMVPSYATSIEGGGVLVLSPDESQVLLVREYGRWGRCGGAVNVGESCLDAALREVVEETALEIDADFTPLLGLCYDQPKSRDGVINDHFMLFFVRAQHMQLEVDFEELEDARWFDRAELVAAWKIAKTQQTDTGGGTVLKKRATLLGEPISVMELLALEKYADGRCQRVQRVDTGRPSLSLMF